MGDLTKEEKAWIKKVQRVLDTCPSDRLGFYTIGDKDVFVYDRSRDSEISKLMDATHNLDYCQAVDDLDADFSVLFFPSHVHSTAG